MDSLTLLKQAFPVLPVVTLTHIHRALPLAETLLESGIRVFEITLRSSCALAAIELIKRTFPDCCIGAGTVIHKTHFSQAYNAGSDFIVAPGITSSWLRWAKKITCPFIPGVASPSDLMLAMHANITCVKFFPAEYAGGTCALDAFLGPFQEVTFCPTGGIDRHNAARYLALKNVVCVGGSWIAPAHLIATSNWKAIKKLIQQSKRQFK